MTGGLGGSGRAIGDPGRIILAMAFFICNGEHKGWDVCIPLVVLVTLSNARQKISPTYRQKQLQILVT
jgi:hypothetical protein